MSETEPWEALKYSFVVDYSKLNFLRQHREIFNAGEKDISKVPNSKAVTDYRYSCSENTVGKQIAVKAGIDASAVTQYGVFSGNASMAVDGSSEMKTKTIRVDSVITARMHDVIASAKLANQPESFLKRNVVDMLNKPGTSMKDIEGVLGHFYCLNCSLGGLFQKSFIMDAMESDNRMDVMAELKAEYGSLLYAAEVTASGSTSSRKSNKNASVRVSWRAEGGNVTPWLSVNQKNAEEVRKEWADSVNDSNLRLSQFNEIRFSWEIVKKVNEKLGEEYQEYLVKKWKAEKFPDGLPWCKLPSIPSVEPGVYYIRTTEHGRGGQPAGWYLTAPWTNRDIHSTWAFVHSEKYWATKWKVEAGKKPGTFRLSIDSGVEAVKGRGLCSFRVGDSTRDNVSTRVAVYNPNPDVNHDWIMDWEIKGNADGTFRILTTDKGLGSQQKDWGLAAWNLGGPEQFPTTRDHCSNWVYTITHGAWSQNWKFEAPSC